MLNFLTSKKFKIFLIWLIFLFLIFSHLSKTLAEEVNPTTKHPTLETLEKIREEVGEGIIPSYSDPILKVVQIINYFLTFIGVIFILVIIYGGILWMTGFSEEELSLGHEEKIKKARTLLKHAIVGLVIVIFAKILYYFIQERLKGGPSGPSGGPTGGGGG